MKSFDAVIIGGGIVGTACAYRLSQAGLSVALIEKRFISAGVTSAGMGHILVMDDSEAQVALTSRSREIWRELSGDLPDICEFENCGTLWVASNEDELEEAVKKESFYRKKGIHAKVVDSEELRRLEPALSEELAGGLRVEDDCVVYQPAAARFFASEAKRMGAVLIENDCGEKLVDSSLTL
ncbi:MAG: FAD-binding oxidoreductase, partial [Pyrinomonadaceae bacterium]|nr:FAD-binding oxidoreductase [Pyrinomonadaceae bacterium]